MELLKRDQRKGEYISSWKLRAHMIPWPLLYLWGYQRWMEGEEQLSHPLTQDCRFISRSNSGYKKSSMGFFQYFRVTPAPECKCTGIKTAGVSSNTIRTFHMCSCISPQKHCTGIKEVPTWPEGQILCASSMSQVCTHWTQHP